MNKYKTAMVILGILDGICMVGLAAVSFWMLRISKKLDRLLEQQEAEETAEADVKMKKGSEMEEVKGEACGMAEVAEEVNVPEKTEEAPGQESGAEKSAEESKSPEETEEAPGKENGTEESAEESKSPEKVSGKESGSAEAAEEVSGPEKVKEEKKDGRPQIRLKAKSVYEPEQLEEPVQLPDGRRIEIQENLPGYLIFNSYSLEKLKNTLEWGKRTSNNIVEEGGILLGNCKQYKGKFYCFVEDIIQAHTMGSSAFVEFTHQMWGEMQQELSELNETREPDDKLIILGWFHTHPNNLSVFMSGTDMGTQMLNFPLDWQISLVMNPHKNIARVFFGRKATDGRIIFPEGAEEIKNGHIF